MGRPKVFRDSRGDWYWERRLTEEFGNRADIYRSVRNDHRLRYARFISPSVPAFRIPMEDLRRATEHLQPRARNNRTFTIDLDRRMVSGHRVRVQFEDARPQAESEPPIDNTERDSKRKGWTGAESEWHRQTTYDVADNPEQYSISNTRDPIIRRWRDSCLSLADQTRLWSRLWTQKHPDVVFEHQSGKLTVVEVEPRHTLIAGIAQLVGDYVANLEIDRRDVGQGPRVEGLLVLDEAMNPDENDLWTPYLHAKRCRVHVRE